MADTNSNTGKDYSELDNLLDEAENSGLIDKTTVSKQTPKPSSAADGKQGKDNSEGDNEQGADTEGDKGKDQGEGKDTLKTQDGEGQSTTKPEEDQDIADEIVLKALQKRGINVASIADLSKPVKELTEEEKKAEAEQRRARSIQFGIENKMFTQADYDLSVKFNAKDPTEVVKEHYIATAKEKYPGLSDEDAEDMFNDEHFLLEDKEGNKYQRGQEKIQQEFKKIADQKFGKINSVADVYSEVEANNKRAETYVTQVKDIFSKEIPKQFSFQVDKQSYTLDVDKSITEEVIKTYLTVESMNALLDQSGKVDKVALMEEVQKDLFWKHKDKIISEVAKSHADAKLTAEKAGRRGVIRHDNGPGANDNAGGSKDEKYADIDAQMEGV